MRQLPERPDLDQLRRQARELQRRSKPMTLSAAQLAVAREYGFPSWTRLKAEVDRRRSILKPEVRTWQGMRDWSAQLLERATGKDVAAWNRVIARRGFANESALRKWLTAQA